MEIEIVTRELRLNIFGFGGTAWNKDYAATAFRLSGKMWDVVKSHHIKNKGKNIWVYNASDTVFAAVELEDAAISGDKHGLETTTLILPKYAYFKHIGPYSMIGQTGQNMRNELGKRGFEVTLPYVEIYGHWTKDETQLETELQMCLK